MIYSVYKGDEEIAAKLKIKPESVKFYGTNVYKNRTTENARRLVKVD